MNTITATEIKRRGISAVDEALSKGPVHVIKNNKPKYVIMAKQHYEGLISEQEESYMERLKCSLDELKRGKTHVFNTVRDLMEEIDHVKTVDHVHR